MKIFVMTSVHRWDDTRIFFRQASSLAQRYTVELHAPAPFKYKVINGIKVFGLPRWKKETDRIKLWWILFMRALRSDATAFHFHDPELLPLGLLLKILTRKKVVYDVHEHYLNDILDKQWIPKCLRRLTSGIFDFFERISVPRFDAVIYTTPIVGERYLSLSQRAISIENYPMLSIFNNSGPARPPIISNDIIYLGRVLYVRGVEEVIRSWPKVVQEFPDARFLIIGDIVPESYEKHLKQVVDELHIQQNVIFCGFVNYDEAAKYLAGALAGVVTFLPYKNNMSCLPNKLFEYMASGIPVIASDFDLYREVIESSECGLLVDPSNTSQLAEAVVYLLGNKREAQKMGRNGRKAFHDRYNWEREEHKLFETYEELLALPQT